jgi:hypothetical protein
VKTETKLIINPNAMLAPSIARQRLESISWRRAQELQGICGVQLRQLADRYISYIRKTLALAGLKQSLRIGATKALYHSATIKRITLSVKIVKPVDASPLWTAYSLDYNSFRCRTAVSQRWPLVNLGR